MRSKEGFLSWPIKSRGAYWSPEIEAACKHLGAKVTFHQVWIAEKHCDHQPYAWVEAIYNYRATLKKIDPLLGLPLKLVINSLYGKFAQSIGEAIYRDYVSAGLITSLTRARLINAIGLVPERDRNQILMLATDGIYSTVPIPFPKSALTDRLGNWEHEPDKQVMQDMFIVQPGMYFHPSHLNTLRKNTEIEASKSPGNRPSLERAARQKAGKHIKARGMRRSIVYDYQPAFENEWEEFLSRKFVTVTDDIIDYPVVQTELDLFIGLELAMAREHPLIAAAIQGRFSVDLAEDLNDYVASPEEVLRQAGKWIQAKREISFDPFRKRSTHMPTLIGKSLYFAPHIGTKDQISIPHNPALLTNYRNQQVLTADLPYRYPVLEDAHNAEKMAEKMSEDDDPLW